MNQRVRVVCGECNRKLACPAAARGKKVRCPECGHAIRVPGADVDGDDADGLSPKRRRRSATAAESGKRRRSPGTDDPYRSTVADSTGDLPPRRAKGKKSDRRDRTKSGTDERHWSKKIIVGAGIMGASVVSNVFQLAIQGPPNMSTAEGKGRAFGQALVTIGGLTFGLVIVVRGFLANRSGR